MNIRPDRIDHSHDESFDSAMRELHAQALVHVSPVTRARLRVGRATAQRAANRGFRWVVAACLRSGLRARNRPAMAKPPTSAVPTQTVFRDCGAHCRRHDWRLRHVGRKPRLLPLAGVQRRHPARRFGAMNMRTSRSFQFLPCRVAMLAILAALSTAPAFAADPPPATLPAWDQLSAAQREQLMAPVRERWNAEPEERARMLKHAQRWRQMTPDQRRHARHGLRRWEHLSPDQRTQMRALFEQSRHMTPEQREAFKQRWEQMTPEQRQAWVKAHRAKTQPLPPPAD